MLGWEKVILVPSYGHREQEIDVRKLLISPDKNIFSPHQHCRYSLETVEIIKKARILPILQTRNIFDTVASLVDHMKNDVLEGPLAFIDDKTYFNIKSKNEIVDFIIDLMIPWYFNFYSGWFSSDYYKNGMIYISNYENLRHDPIKHVCDILNWANIPADINLIASSIKDSGKMNTRKNKGIIGRGALLTTDQKEKIIRFASYYNHIDFSPIGITQSLK